MSEKKYGAYRWILIFGFTIQPSEYLKIIMVLFTAYLISKNKIKIQHSFKVVFQAIVMVIIPISPLFIHTDLGSLVLIFSACITLLIIAKVPFIRFILPIGISAFSALAIIIYLIPNRINRVINWFDSFTQFNPCIDTTSQVCYSIKAIQAANYFGVGLGNGQIKHKIFAVESDLILAVVFEELGIIGFLLVTGYFILTLLFAKYVYEGLKLKHQFLLAYFALGIGLIFSLQFAMNSLGVTGIIPIKGITVPFLSAGLNSFIVSIFSVVILLKLYNIAYGK